MEQPVGVCFAPETIELLQKVLDEAWDALSESRQQKIVKAEVAERILTAAGLGERDPERLKAIALMRPMDPTTVSRAAAARAAAISANLLRSHG